MSNQERQNNGKFAPKSDTARQVRSIRLTDRAWNRLGELADLRSITRADLIESLVENNILSQDNIAFQESSQAYVDEVEALKNKILELEKQIHTYSDTSNKAIDNYALDENLGEIYYGTAKEIFNLLGVTEGQLTGWDARKTLPKFIDKEGKKYKIYKNTVKDKSKKAWCYQEVIINI